MDGITKRLIRLAKIDAILRSGKPQTYDAIGRQLGVSWRTIYNDFVFLADTLGAPIDLAGPQSHSGWEYFADWDLWNELRQFVEKNVEEN